jgi:hypothetical protein
MMMMAMGADGNGGRGAPFSNFSNHSDNGVFVYIVQRSGYAGWQQSQPPVDYRRLLMTRAEADQVAYGSAHHFANGGPVRTIQLPDGSFGSVSSNYLFWVRKVSATATTTTTASGGASTNNATGGGTTNNKVFGEAHCVLSDGLLGGTSKRRNMLVAEKHSIFVGPHSSHAALQYLTSHRSLAEKGATIQWVPVGLPPSLAQLTQEWPVAVGTTTNVHAPPGSTNNMDVSESSLRSTSSSRSSSKRAGDDDDNVVWFHHPNTTNHQPRAVDMMETARTTKRACWARSHTAEGMVIE